MGGRIAVASVIMNRVKRGGWFGSSIQGVILKPKQFSCFNTGDPNRLKLMAIASEWAKNYQRDKALRECMFVAEGVISGDLKSNVFDATHYKTINCQAAWAAKMKQVAVIGQHEFYTDQKGAA
jgi:spore germination cell wall hydrolase CwlJ-like protein